MRLQMIITHRTASDDVTGGCRQHKASCASLRRRGSPGLTAPSPSQLRSRHNRQIKDRGKDQGLVRGRRLHHLSSRLSVICQESRHTHTRPSDVLSVLIISRQASAKEKAGWKGEDRELKHSCSSSLYSRVPTCSVKRPPRRWQTLLYLSERAR